MTAPNPLDHAENLSQRCASVELSPISTDDDYESLARWASSAAGIYASGERNFVSAAAFRESLRGSADTFLMVRDREGRAIGAVSWRPMECQGNYTIGNMIGERDLWDGGLGVESVGQLIEYLFHARNAHRVQFICGTYNKPMIEIYCSGLIHVEGVLRDYYFLDGTYHDAVIGSILQADYYSALAGMNLRPFDVIPAAEKERARGILLDYLQKNPIRVTPESKIAGQDLGID